MPKKEVAVKDQSTDIAVSDWEKELEQYAAEASKDERPAASYISLKAGILSYSGTPIPDNKLECVIIDSCVEHTFYKGKYDPNKLESPDCFSLTKEADDAAPHAMSADPQGDEDGKCAGCPMNQWGSGNGRGKACQERRRLIVIPKDLATGDDIIAAEVAVMKIPVTSVKNWSQYVNTVSAMYKRPPFAMVTEISTAPDPKSQFKVMFKPVEQLDVELMPAIMEKRKISESVLLKPYDKSVESEEQAPAENTKYSG